MAHSLAWTQDRVKSFLAFWFLSINWGQKPRREVRGVCQVELPINKINERYLNCARYLEITITTVSGWFTRLPTLAFEQGNMPRPHHNVP